MKFVLILSFLGLANYSQAFDFGDLIDGIEATTKYRCVAAFQGRVRRHAHKPTTFEGWAKKKWRAEDKALSKCENWFPRRAHRCQIIKCHRKFRL